MRKMSILLPLIMGLIACLWLVRRQTRSTPAPRTPAAATEFKAVNDWQQTIRVDTRTDYHLDEATRQRLREKLGREEAKQRPQEGRN